MGQERAWANEDMLRPEGQQFVIKVDPQATKTDQDTPFAVAGKIQLVG
jgi:hypothetical protein